MTDAVGGGAVKDVREESVAVRGHRDEIDAVSPPRVTSSVAGSPIASCVVTVIPRAVSSRWSSLEIRSVGLHLFRFAQLQLVEVARGPAVRDVNEQELARRCRGERATTCSRIVRSAAEFSTATRMWRYMRSSYERLVQQPPFSTTMTAAAPTRATSASAGSRTGPSSPDRS